jgi:hypothetical protein
VNTHVRLLTESELITIATVAVPAMAAFILAAIVVYLGLATAATLLTRHPDLAPIRYQVFQDLLGFLHDLLRRIGGRRGR